MPSKAIFYPRRLSQTFRRGSTGSAGKRSSEKRASAQGTLYYGRIELLCSMISLESTFDNIRKMIQDIQAQKRTSGMSLDTNPEETEQRLQSALNSARNSDLPRLSFPNQFRRVSLLDDLRRPSNIFAVSEEGSSEGWLSSVVTPVGTDNLSFVDQTQNEQIEAPQRKRAPPPEVKVTIENGAVF